MKRIMFFAIVTCALQASFLEAAQQPSAHKIQSQIDKEDPYYMGCDEDYEEREAERIKWDKEMKASYLERERKDKANYENYLKDKYEKSANTFLVGYGPIENDKNGNLITFDAWKKNNYSYSEYLYGNWRNEISR